MLLRRTLPNPECHGSQSPTSAQQPYKSAATNAAIASRCKAWEVTQGDGLPWAQQHGPNGLARSCYNTLGTKMLPVVTAHWHMQFWQLPCMWRRHAALVKLLPNIGTGGTPRYFYMHKRAAPEQAAPTRPGQGSDSHAGASALNTSALCWGDIIPGAVTGRVKQGLQAAPTRKLMRPTTTSTRLWQNPIC